MTRVTSVPDRLRAAADLFEERNRQYGSNFVTMGPVLHAMFPQGLTIETPDEWQRIFSIVMFAMKTTRYASNVRRGGHRDSLDDQAVYSLMAAYTDDLAQHQSEESMAAVQEALRSTALPTLVVPAPHVSQEWCTANHLVPRYEQMNWATAKLFLLCNPGSVGARRAAPREGLLSFYWVSDAEVSQIDRQATDWEIWYKDGESVTLHESMRTSQLHPVGDSWGGAGLAMDGSKP